MSGKVILGGAQLGLNYGVTDQKLHFGRLNSEDILSRAKELGITHVDIAYEYGDIFRWINDINPGLSLISKVKLFNNSKSADVLVKHLRLKNLKCILVHDADQFLPNKHCIEQVERFLKFCNDNGFLWGLSVYQIETIKKFNKIGCVPRLVQYPLNVLCANDDIGSLCARLRIETHVRSVMLQGLLVAGGVHELPDDFRRNKSLIRWYDWIAQQGLNPIDVCLCGDNMANRTKILGVKTGSQLQDLIQKSKGHSLDCRTLPKSSDKKLLDPRNWTVNQS